MWNLGEVFSTLSLGLLSPQHENLKVDYEMRDHWGLFFLHDMESVLYSLNPHMYHTCTCTTSAALCIKNFLWFFIESLLQNELLGTPQEPSFSYIHFRGYSFMECSCAYQDCLAEGVPMFSRVWTWLVSMKMWVQFLSSLSGLRIQCCCEQWSRSLMWLGSRVAVALV